MTFAITILVPLLFSILEFGSALERWLAQDAATVQAARYAGELGGDAPELRRFLDDELRAAGIDFRDEGYAFLYLDEVTPPTTARA